MYSQSSLLSPLLFIWQKCLELKTSLLAQQKGTQSSLERLKTLIRLIQNEQMIQVTMTTTTTSSLLTVPWIKPSSASAAMHKALQQSQGNNWQSRLWESERRGEKNFIHMRRWEIKQKQRREGTISVLIRVETCKPISPVCRSLWQQVPTARVMLQFCICRDLQCLWDFFCYVGLNVFMTKDEEEKYGR